VYPVFFGKIKKLGYQGNKNGTPLYQKNDVGHAIYNANGEPMLDEDFSTTVQEYHQFLAGQSINTDNCFALNYDELNGRFDYDFYAPENRQLRNNLVDKKAVRLGDVVEIVKTKSKKLTQKETIVEYVELSDINTYAFEIINSTQYAVHELPRETVKDILEKSKSSFSKGEDRDEAIKKVGVLCTDATIKSEIYKKELEKNNIEIVYPDEVFQKDLMEIIYKEIKKNGNLNIERFAKIINHMQEKGSDVIILACTELSLFKNYYEVKETCVDAMNSLVKKSIELSGKEFQKPVYNYSIKEIFKKVLRIAELKIKKSFK
jgi:hypothetical protein